MMIRLFDCNVVRNDTILVLFPTGSCMSKNPIVSQITEWIAHKLLNLQLKVLIIKAKHLKKVAHY